MNTLAYLIYLLQTYLITARVGLIFYRNGRIFSGTLTANAIYHRN